MDYLSKLSDSDLKLLMNGNVKMMSKAGLSLVIASQPVQQQDPTADMSTLDKGLAGYGKSITDLVSGAGERLGLVSKEDIAKKRLIDAPLMNTTSGKVGNAIGMVANTAPAMFVPGANTYAGSAAIGAGLGSLQPTVEGESVGKNMVIGASGGLLGQGVGKAIPAIGGYVGDKLKNIGTSLVQSALKPSKNAVKSGDAAKAIQAIMNEKLNVSSAGWQKARGLVSDIDNEISNKLANSNAQISKVDVVPYLDDTRRLFGSTPNHITDLPAIDTVENGLWTLPTSPNITMPVTDAQATKQAIYKVLDKSYGKLGSADTEAQKAIARGLKEEIAKAVPEVSPLNARQGDLLSSLKLIGDRVAVEGNKNPIGLGWLTIDPSLAGLAKTGGWLADRSGSLKSLAGRKMYDTGLLSQKLNSGSISPLLPYLGASGLLNFTN